ncbi:MAG: phage tail sheath family protein, partial [Gemmatimonadota bacterium]
VYIQEVPSSVNTITGVATSVAAFLGRASKGPIDRAVRLFSYADFVRSFGEPHPKSDLADSVRLFFANGGTDCYVIRLAHDARAARVVLQSLEGDNVLQVTAKARGEWANVVRLTVDYGTVNPYESFNLGVIHEEGGAVVAEEIHRNLSMNPDSPRFAPTFVKQSSDLVDVELHDEIGPVTDPNAEINDLAESFPGFSQSRRRAGNLDALKTLLNDLLDPGAGMARHKFDISVNGGEFRTVDLKPWPTAASLTDAGTTGAQIAGHIKDRIEAAVTPATVAVQLATGSNYIKIVSTGGDQSSVRVRQAASNDIAAPLMLGTAQGGVEPTRWSNFRPAATASLLPFGAGRMMEQVDETAEEVGDLQQNAFNAITIDGVAVALDGSGDFDIRTTDPADPWVMSSPEPGSPNGDMDGIREKLRIMAQAITAEPGLPYRAEVWGYHLALITTDDNDNATPTTIATGEGVFDDDQKLNVSAYPLAGVNTRTTSAFVETGEGQDGDDGSAPQVADYLGDPAKQTGMRALDSVDLFNLLVIPGDEEVGEATMNQIRGPASNYCAGHRAFMLIDPPGDWTDDDRPAVVQSTSKIDGMRAAVVNENSAVFYPRLRYASNGTVTSIGASGAIAGLMARIDSTRGVWKAPAGTEADIRGILGLEVELTDMENGVLNKKGVNCLRTFPQGVVSWGARTLDGDDDFGSEWKYVPIRRFALFLEESLYRGTKWIVFEPNDEPLWAKIRLNLNAFMMGLFRQGAFQGGTPDKAFYVKCDAETTTQADRDRGIVNIEVGFAPLKPAEFVVIRIQQMAGDL